MGGKEGAEGAHGTGKVTENGDEGSAQLMGPRGAPWQSICTMSIETTRAKIGGARAIAVRLLDARLVRSATTNFRSANYYTYAGFVTLC